MTRKIWKLFALLIGVPILVMIALAFLSIIGAVPVYFLWNWLITDLFDLSRLAFWQAWGIFWLASILFKGPTALPKR